MESSKQPARAGRYAVARLILLAVVWQRGANGLADAHPSSLDGGARLIRSQVTGLVARQVTTPANEYFTFQNRFCANKANPRVTNTGDIFERDLSSSTLGSEAAWSVSQSFRYDRLGRLTTFQEKLGSTTTDVETSAYDQ